jgi:polysaccharide biosynthesis transport protein
MAKSQEFLTRTNLMSDEKRMLSLPAPVPSAASEVMLERPVVYQGQSESAEAEGSSLPISHYLWLLNREKWKLLAFVLVVVASTIIISSRLTPYYQATATIDVDRMMPTGVLGQDANANRASVNDSEQFLSTQVKLIQSDSVLRPVAQRFKLRIAEVGGGSQKVPSARVQDAPVTLSKLAITRPPKTYLLQISYRSPDPELAADVANAVARSFIDHTYAIRFQASSDLASFVTKQLDELRAKMERSSAALAQFEKELNVISPEEKTSILTARLLQLNTEYTTAQGDRVKLEAAAKSVKSGSAEAVEASLVEGEQLRKLQDHLNEEQEKFDQAKAQYGPNHPEYKKAAARVAELQRQFEALKGQIVQRVDVEYRQAVNREQMLQQAVNETKTEFDSLNSRSLEYKALKRDADADKALYDELTKKINEAGINSGFQGSSIRLADLARPALKPVFPNTRLNALLALLSSTLLGMGVVFFSDSLDHTIRDPEQIRRELRTEVLGALPVVKAWRGHLPGSKSGKDGALTTGPQLIFEDGRHATDAYEEAMRTLRDSILLPNLANPPRTLLMTSATPREGKTTTAVHLAVVHSQQKRRTLLIDADLRRPSIYGHLGISNDHGLTDVVNGHTEWRTLLQIPDGLPDLAVLPAGRPSRRAADGLGKTLRTLLDDAANDFDLIICDAPPLLGFAESLQIAALVDGIVVVALAGRTQRPALASVVGNLRRLNTHVMGVVLNEVRQDLSDRYYYYGYYGKYYGKYYKRLKD